MHLRFLPSSVSFFVLALTFLAGSSASAQSFTTPRARYDMRGNITMTGNASHTCSTANGARRHT